MSNEITPFESIRRTNPAGNEFWSSRDFARELGYVNHRHFQSVIESARTACFNSGQRVEDHFVEITDMIEVGKGAKRPAKSVMMSRYACYLVIQNADPSKEIVAQGQTYFAIQTRRPKFGGASRFKCDAPRKKVRARGFWHGAPRSKCGAPRSKCGAPRSKCGAPRSKCGTPRSKCGSP